MAVLTVNKMKSACHYSCNSFFTRYWLHYNNGQARIEKCSNEGKEQPSSTLVFLLLANLQSASIRICEGYGKAMPCF